MMILALYAATTLFVSQEFGRDDRWTSGWSGGVSEAVITRGPGNEIYVTCNDGGNVAAESSISFMLGGKVPAENSEVTLTFDNADPFRVGSSVDSNCRSCASTFDYVIAALKRHRSVHVMFQDGTSARFPLTGSAKAIGECTADFWR